MNSLFDKLQNLKLPPVVSRYLSGGEEPDGMTRGTLERYQTDSLRAIVQRAYQGSPFYRTKMDRADVCPEDIRGLADLEKLPFLTKGELRGHPWILLTCDKKDVALIQVSTGTTGGEEIYMMYTWRDYLLHDLSPRYSRLFPVGPGDVCLNALPYEMSTAGLAFHKTFMDGYQATVIPAGKGGAYSTPAKTLKVIEDLRPNVIVTSPSWAITLAEEAAGRGFDLTGLHVKRMWLTGEGCSPAFRSRVEGIWGTTANFFYGSLECGALGIECDQHDGYHLPQAHVILEIVDPRTGAPLGPGETGEIVVTALLRYDSPILRFRTGDLGVVDTAPCACGVALPRFHMRGRAVDQIRAAGRSFSPVYLEEILMRAPEVGNWFQFVVPARSSDGIKIRCETSKGQKPTPELADALAGRMRAATGATFQIELVEKIPRSPGKAARVVHE